MTELSLTNDNKIIYASARRRLGAFLVDLGILSILIILSAAKYMYDIADPAKKFTPLVSYCLIALGLFYINKIIFYWKYEATLGQCLMKIRLRENNDQRAGLKNIFLYLLPEMAIIYVLMSIKGFAPKIIENDYLRDSGFDIIGIFLFVIANIISLFFTKNK